MARDKTIRPEGRGIRVSGVRVLTDEMDEIAGEPEPATSALIEHTVPASEQ